MSLDEVVTGITSGVRSAGAAAADRLTPTLRLGVTGLSRSGKTVFLTALVHNLVHGGRLPFFSPMAMGRLRQAYLTPQPDDALPRFAYERHLAALTGTEPAWPESTRHISQLRLTIDYAPSGIVRRLLRPHRLHVDIVDYPGEWLLDLPLLEMSYETWARRAWAQAEAPSRRHASAAWRIFAQKLDPLAPEAEDLAEETSRLFTAYLQESRKTGQVPSVLSPGRFLMPGDMAGSPALTFSPLRLPETGTAPRGSLWAMMARRFQAYKTHVVKPFFRDHFARLDRQIVLVDVLSALNDGPDAMADLEQALTEVLTCFRPGKASWLSSILGRRIDRILFAATKADHLHHSNHDRLEALLAALTGKAAARARFAGAQVRNLAMAAVRATRETEVREGGEHLPCIRGVPEAGERLGETVFDGKEEVVLFPGDLPDSLEAAFAPVERGKPPGPWVKFLRFRPPPMGVQGQGGEMATLPHIRLDRALDFLLGDYLA